MHSIGLKARTIALPGRLRTLPSTKVPGRHATLRELFHELDGDKDGKLTSQEVEALVAKLGLQQAAASTPAPAAPAKPLTWELSLAAGMSKPNAGQAFLEFCATKLGNRHKNRVALSDVVWSFLGMFAAVFLLGEVSLHVRELPLVHSWHEKGLNLLLGSFGTIAVLLFGRPDAEAIKPWNLLLGHVVSVAVVMWCITVMGPGVISRATAMAATIAVMLYTDSVHPPGGALILMAEDSGVIQSMQGWFLVYPSLAWTVLLLLPIGLLTNWLKRNVRFDWPTAQAPAQQGGSGDGGVRLKAA